MRGRSVFFLLCAFAVPAWAQSGDGQIETVVVTAAPPDPVGNDAFSVVHLDAAALRRSPQLDTALGQVPGLSLFRRNSSLSANPTTQGVSLRSIAPSGAGRALVTLDGVPQNDPFGGWVIWSALPGEDIARAEVVRGAGAGPYGAGALTGVIALSERQGDGLAAADVSAGSLNTRRAAAAGGTQIGALAFFGSVSDETSDGWIPVAPDQRGAADDAVTLNARSASLRVSAQPVAGTLISVRGAVYDEKRDAGLVGARSDARGVSASLTIAHPQNADELGWRLQGWLRETGFANSSVAIAPLRAATTPANDQYATPATGFGVNAALRGGDSALDWELGMDMRGTSGESRERASYISGAFTLGRVAGGRTFVGGVYAEGAARFSGWLLTVGLRADDWATTGGHLRQTSVVSGAVTSDRQFGARHGAVPTARVGLRRDLSDGLYLRSAVYGGFRAPTLNELYRPYRVGNSITEANAALTPEKLYGAEIGIGGDKDAFVWDATAFWNQLHGAITNVTIGQGPGNFPGAGFVPAGGLLFQRRNAGDIDAYGVEAAAHYRLSDALRLNAAFDYGDAHVEGGVQAPQLTGKRPSQAPRFTLTGGMGWAASSKLLLSADLRYESARFADDQNTLSLTPALSVSARAAWRLTQHLSAYVAADNLFNSRIETTQSADGIFNDAAPRIIRIGLSYGG
jgi:outer membrane receptor protein involved in Fe transport